MLENEIPGYVAEWYEIVESRELRQGDIIQGLPVFALDPKTPFPDPNVIDPRNVTMPGQLMVGTWIIATPSCDMATGRNGSVLLGLCLPASLESVRAQGEKDLLQKLEVVRRGLDPSKFLLPRHAEVPMFPLSLVIVRTMAMVPLEPLQAFVATKRRLRLRHPLREKLGNWFATWISNVGPEDRCNVPPFENVHAKHILDANS